MSDQLNQDIYPDPDGSDFHWKLQGFCPVCDENVLFVATHHWLRDQFFCTNCHSLPRERALMAVVNEVRPDWRNLRIHEAGSAFRGASLKLHDECKNYVGSTYDVTQPYGLEVTLQHHDRVFQLMNEDLEDQSFADACFDLVITQDCMEHVFDPARAFAEIERTLKAGGVHIFTVPMLNRHMPSQVWATKAPSGEPHFLYEPDYHGPYPVTMHWGFDIIDFIKTHCRMDTEIRHVDDLRYGIRAQLPEVLISRKV